MDQQCILSATRLLRHLSRAGAALLAALFVFAGPLTGEALAQSCGPTVAGAISGLVFLDSNGNGTRQADEEGVNGVVLHITGPSGSSVVVTSGGVANIPGLYTTGPVICEVGSFTVEIVSVPSGYTAPGPASATVTLTQDPSGRFSKLNNINFPIVLAPCTSSIGDFVWNDLNANGIQEAGEPGIPGVTVQLFDTGGNVIQTTTTNANGFYNFVVPCSNSYYVQVVPPAGFVASPTLQGGNVNVDSDTNPTLVTIGSDEHRTDIDFGFYAACQGVIGDFVWHDLDRDGVQDAGEPGIYNVKIELLQGGVVVRTTFTDANGHYEFTGLCPGDYQVRYDPATVPTGFQPTLTGQGTTGTDSNAAPATVTLTDFNSSDLTIDFGFQVPCSGVIGDFVWHDLNRNGVQDAGEPGIPGVQVRLYRAGESAPMQATVTDANGYYQFTGICGGDFVVEVNPTTLPAGITWFQSPANQGSNDTVDSDGVDHRASVSLPADDSTDLTIDFGYFKKLALTASKTAAGSYDKRITWTLTKTVDPSSFTGNAGQTVGTSTWTVTTTKSETLSNYSVTGSVTVNNPNAFDVTFAVTDQLNDGTAAVVSCPTDTVPASSSVICSYSASPSGATATLNTATVSSELGDTTATATVGFTANVIGDTTTTLGDARFSYSQAISTGGTVTFPETFTCPADATLYTNGTYSFTVTNTATLTGANTNLSASANVNVTCKQQFSTGTATGYGTQYPGTSNWFMYTPYTTSKVDLVSGRDLKGAGDIYMSRSGSGSSARTTIRIVLNSGWSLANVADVVKINPFNTAPTTFIQPGAFLYKFTAPNIAGYPGTTISVSGNTIIVTMPGTSARFYGIHLDVRRLLP